jgi:molecular chaperone HscB
MNYYRVLGLEPKLQLDGQELQQIFYRRSRELHPDRFARASKEQQAAALEESSLLNDAYRTLKDPVTRAEYFLKESGFDISNQGTKNVPPELLEEVFELNMLLEEAAPGPELAAAAAKFQTLLAAADQEMEALFARPEPPLEELRQLLNRRRYIANLVREIAARQT